MAGEGARPTYIQPAIELFQCQFALAAVPFLPIADFVLQGRQKIKGNVRRLEIFGIGMSHVMNQRAESRGPWWRYQLRSGRQGCGMNASHQAGRYRFNISLHPANLAGEETRKITEFLQASH